jgi:hypothetical protein
MMVLLFMSLCVLEIIASDVAIVLESVCMGYSIKNTSEIFLYSKQYIILVLLKSLQTIRLPRS